MRSPLRLTLPLITHSGDGASDAETAPSRAVCAFTGTEAAPRIIVVLFRCRQSHGAMNDPDHRPACASLAARASGVPGVMAGPSETKPLLFAAMFARSSLNRARLCDHENLGRHLCIGADRHRRRNLFGPRADERKGTSCRP